MSKKLLLLAEDNPDDQTLIIDALSELDIPHKVRLFDNGVDLLKYLHSDINEAQPLALLLDLKLPLLSGHDVLKRLRDDQRTRFLPVIILSSSNEESDRTLSYAEGANSYVCKPIEYSQFLSTVKQLGLYWLSINLPAGS